LRQPKDGKNTGEYEIKKERKVQIMLKGAQKRMVELRTVGNALFETAYFVLRDDCSPAVCRDDDSLLREADRIIRDTLSPAVSNKKRGRRTLVLRSVALFLLGMLLGGALATVIMLLLGTGVG
jgi:hypothetical protein